MFALVVAAYDFDNEKLQHPSDYTEHSRRNTADGTERRNRADDGRHLLRRWWLPSLSLSPRSIVGSWRLSRGKSNHRGNPHYNMFPNL